MCVCVCVCVCVRASPVLECHQAEVYHLGHVHHTLRSVPRQHAPDHTTCFPQLLLRLFVHVSSSWVFSVHCHHFFLALHHVCHFLLCVLNTNQANIWVITPPRPFTQSRCEKPRDWNTNTLPQPLPPRATLNCLSHPQLGALLPSSQLGCTLSCPLPPHRCLASGVTTYKSYKENNLCILTFKELPSSKSSRQMDQREGPNS